MKNVILFFVIIILISILFYYFYFFKKDYLTPQLPELIPYTSSSESNSTSLEFQY